MAIDFDGTGDWLRNTATPVISGMPFSMACWFNPDNVTSRCCLMSIFDISGGFNQHSLYAGGTIAGDPVQAESQNFLTVFAANTVAGYRAGLWQHACGVWVSATDRRAYLNGSYKGTDANSVADPGATLDSITIGALGSNSLPMFGCIAYPAVWSVALSDAEVADLGAGAHPRTIQPANLLFFASLYDERNPQFDEIGPLQLDVAGNPTKCADDPILRDFIMGQVLT